MDGFDVVVLARSEHPWLDLGTAWHLCPADCLLERWYGAVGRSTGWGCNGNRLVGYRHRVFRSNHLGGMAATVGSYSQRPELSNDGSASSF